MVGNVFVGSGRCPRFIACLVGAAPHPGHQHDDEKGIKKSGGYPVSESIHESGVRFSATGVW